MNRMEEYNALMQELEETPARLNFTVARAKARTRRQKIRRYIGTPAASLAAVCLAFVLLVNVSAPFAMACAKVPVLKDLAAAVVFSTSLSAAVENDWVQPVGQTARDGGYTMTVEYLIVDQKQLNIFYRLEGGGGTDPEDHYMLYSDLLDEQGEFLPASIITGSSKISGELYCITADFTSFEDTMPGQLRLDCELSLDWDDSENKDRNETVARFAFDLSFDPKFTAQGTVLELDRWLELDGQRVLLKSVEIYPTHMRINLEDDPENTAWLRGLDFYVEDEDGNRFDAGSNGLISTGSPDSPFTGSYWVESAFFAGGEHLTLCVTGAKWLEKDRQWTWVELSGGVTGYLPEGVTLLEHSRSGGDAKLVFRSYTGGTYSNPFSQWKDAGGETRSFGGFGVAAATVENPDGPDTVLEGYCDVHLTLENPGGDRVELELSATKWAQYDKPVEIPVS